MRGRRGRPQPGSYRGQGLGIPVSANQPNTTSLDLFSVLFARPPQSLQVRRARTVRILLRIQGGGEIPPPKVQFKLYQGEVLQYKPGASDHRCGRMDLALVQIDLYQELGESTQSETPESALQSERGRRYTTATNSRRLFQALLQWLHICGPPPHICW